MCLYECVCAVMSATHTDCHGFHLWNIVRIFVVSLLDDTWLALSNGREDLNQSLHMSPWFEWTRKLLQLIVWLCLNPCRIFCSLNSLFDHQTSNYINLYGTFHKNQLRVSHNKEKDRKKINDKEKKVHKYSHKYSDTTTPPHSHTITLHTISKLHTDSLRQHGLGLSPEVRKTVPMRAVQKLNCSSSHEAFAQIMLFRGDTANRWTWSQQNLGRPFLRHNGFWLGSAKWMCRSMSADPEHISYYTWI